MLKVAISVVKHLAVVALTFAVVLASAEIGDPYAAAEFAEFGTELVAAIMMQMSAAFVAQKLLTVAACSLNVDVVVYLRH